MFGGASGGTRGCLDSLIGVVVLKCVGSGNASGRLDSKIDAVGQKSVTVIGGMTGRLGQCVGLLATEGMGGSGAVFCGALTLF
jgi:hypothetical protein